MCPSTSITRAAITRSYSAVWSNSRVVSHALSRAPRSPRRLCTIAGFYRYAVEEELLDHSPAAHVRRPWLGYESHAVALDRNELGALLVAAGLGSALERALISLLALNGLRVPEATGADIEYLGLERGHRTLTITRRGGKVVIPEGAGRCQAGLACSAVIRSGTRSLPPRSIPGPRWRCPRCCVPC